MLYFNLSKIRSTQERLYGAHITKKVGKHGEIKSSMAQKTLKLVADTAQRTTHALSVT